MAVHDIDVDAVGSGLLGLGHLLSEPCKVRRQDAWGNLDCCTIHQRLQMLALCALQEAVLHLSDPALASLHLPERRDGLELNLHQ